MLGMRSPLPRARGAFTPSTRISAPTPAQRPAVPHHVAALLAGSDGEARGGRGVYARVCVCVRACVCVRMCVCARVRACAFVLVRACTSAYGAAGAAVEDGSRERERVGPSPSRCGRLLPLPSSESKTESLRQSTTTAPSPSHCGSQAGHEPCWRGGGLSIRMGPPPSTGC